MKCENGLCQFSMSQHFDLTQLTCLNNTLVNTSFTSDRTCNSHLGLRCLDFKCQCDLTKKFWSFNEQKCVDLLN